MPSDHPVTQRHLEIADRWPVKHDLMTADGWRKIRAQWIATFEAETVAPLLARIAELEAKNARLQGKMQLIADFKCDDGDEAGAFFAVRMHARTTLKGPDNE